MKTNTLTAPSVKANKKTILIVALIVAVIGTVLIILSKAAVVPGTPAFGLYVSPSTASPAVGSQFSVSVYANTGTYSVQSVAAKIKYDPAQLRLDSADQNGTINVPVKLYCTASEGCAAGTALFSIGKFGYGTANTIPPTDGLLVGNLTFTALKAGPANVDIDDSADPQTGARLSGFTSSVVSDTDPTPYIALNILNGRTVQGGVYTVKDGTPPTVPGKPVAGTIGMSSINLTWPASTDSEAGASGMSGYKIYRNGVQVGTSTGASFNDGVAPLAPLTPNTTYSYTVSAYDVAGNNSAQSTALSAKTLPDTQAPTVPGKPVGGAVTMTEINLTWSASTDNVALSGYKILRNGTQVGTSPTASYKDIGLVAGTSYSYTVIAYDTANNNSAPSSATAVTTAPDTTPPTKPTISTATTASGNVTLSWTGSTDNVAVTGYRILRGGTQVGTTLGNVTSFTNQNVPVGTYSYTVIAVDAVGLLSPASDAKIVTLYGSADVDQSGAVNIQDIATVLKNYGKSGVGIPGDANRDGAVNIQDIALILSLYGTAG